MHYLVAGANGVRKLVRVKIADDNDLEQARKALKSTDMFFKALYHRAKESNMTPYELLQQAEKFSYVWCDARDLEMQNSMFKIMKLGFLSF